MQSTSLSYIKGPAFFAGPFVNTTPMQYQEMS